MTPRRPNIVLILADDMGFSDLGCYGSEIPTPNLDRLAAGGIRFTQMYNFARCCPSRAALLTGLNPHQAGIGHMTGGIPGPPEYQGFLRLDCVTVAQVLRDSGYRTGMSGKWHVGENPAEPGAPEVSSPRRRGFDRVFGIAGGCGSYYFCENLWNDDEIVESEPGFYLTDAISDNAVRMIEESAALGRPFFQYVAYTAPHWPLHAPEEAVARHVGKYRKGWDALRTARHEEMKGLGILDSRWKISPRDEDVPPWDDASDKEWEDLRMAVYAAQVEIMDQGIGRIVKRLESLGILDDTLVMFLSDNGGCAEYLEEDPTLPGHRSIEIPGAGTTPDGRRVRTGNYPSIAPGPDDTYLSYDVQWANVSNTPFRRHKRWVHEGGISTPFIVALARHGRQAEPGARAGAAHRHHGDLHRRRGRALPVRARRPGRPSPGGRQPEAADRGRGHGERASDVLGARGPQGGAPWQLEARLGVWQALGAVRHGCRPHRTTRPVFERPGHGRLPVRPVRRVGGALRRRALGNARRPGCVGVHRHAPGRQLHDPRRPRPHRTNAVGIPRPRETRIPHPNCDGAVLQGQAGWKPAPTR